MKSVPMAKLEEGMVLAQNVYSEIDSDTIVLRKGTKLTSRAIESLKRWGVFRVHIQEPSDAHSLAELMQAVKNPVVQAAPSINEQLRDDALTSLENIFETATLEKNSIHTSAQVIEGLDNVVDKMVESITSVKGALLNITDLKSYDDYTYHHSLSVSAIAIGIGEHMGISGKNLNRLGLSGIMHDIGKTAIPVELIRKPSRLDDEEFRLIKTHSTAGWKYLTTSSIGDEEIWRAVLYHHEKTNGTGYPEGLKNDEIPLWSRIISVADVYDALTSNRPYRSPMQPAEAMEFLMGGVGSSFDFDAVSGMLKKMDLYPVGSVLELSDERYAIVLDSENQLRPIVEVLGDGQVIDLYRDRSALSLVIKRLVPQEELKHQLIVPV